MTGKQWMVTWTDTANKDHQKIFESYEEAKDYYERRKDSTMTYQSRKTLKLWSRIVTSWKEIQV